MNIFYHTYKNLLSIAFCLCTISLAAQQSRTLKVSDETFEILQKVSKSSLADGEVLLSLTTHQDLGWVDEIEKCVVMRDTQWITPFLERLEVEPGFEMDIEQSSIIMEYIQRHPDKKEEITRRLKEGRMLIGATYMQPYEEMYFSESLARQFYLGKLWLKKEFDGYSANTYYNTDVPGRVMQMPQLMSKAEVDNMFISRHERGVFDWYSPDGSAATAYSPGHYIDFYNVLAKENEAAVKELASQALIWTTGYNDVPGKKTVMPAVLNFEFIWAYEPVENLEPFMALWNELEEVENEAGDRIKVALPEIKFSTIDKFFSQIKRSSEKIPSIKGERPNVWLYIHGPSHHWAMDHSRKADMLLPAVEKFATADALVSGSFARYPLEMLDQAWRSKIYPDHGWGGKGGQSTDDIFLNRFADAQAKAEQMLESTLNSLASKVTTSHDKGVPLVIFNSLSWNRTSPVNCQLKFDPETAKSVQLFSKDGQQIPVQISAAESDKNGFLLSAKICFVAEQVPSIGFDTYYVKFSEEHIVTPVKRFTPIVENAFFRAEFSDGGLSSLIDKQLNKELIDASFFKAGEVFTMKSEGNGAGEFSEVQPVEMVGFDKSGNYSTQWEVIADGEVFTSYKYRQEIRNAVAELQVTLYHQIKKIDFNIAINNWDGTMFREYRMALPLNITEGDVAYDAPFGVVEVGKSEMEGIAGYGYITPCRELHPRGIENWISASGNDFGVTLSSSVVGMDYMDPTEQDLSGTILQPILLASRRSCHHEGNDYHQTGDHSFSFSITSHESGWNNGFRFGKESNESLFAVYNPLKYATATLSESQSFLSIDAESVVISAMKKAEDEDAVAVRFYNLKGEEVEMNLTFWKEFDKAFETNLIEEVKSDLEIDQKDLKMKIGKYEIETIKLK